MGAGPPGPPGGPKPHCEPPGPNCEGAGGPNAKAQMKMADPAVKKAPITAPTSPAPTTTPVPCLRLPRGGGAAAGAAGAGPVAEVLSVLALLSSVVT